MARQRPDLYASLCRALQSEDDVLVIYDRRTEPVSPPRRWRSLWSTSELAFDQGDRRRRTDVDDEIRERGFGVVHLTGAYEDYDDEPLDPLHDED